MQISKPKWSQRNSQKYLRKTCSGCALKTCWTENSYWQYFCGEEYFQHKMPIHPTTMTKWRNRLGKSGSEKLLIETIKAGLKSKTIKPGSLKKVTVDTTVQEKNIAFPTDSKLLNKARENLVKLSKEHGIKLRQNYNRVGPQYVLMASRYAHAKLLCSNRLSRSFLSGLLLDTLPFPGICSPWGRNLSSTEVDIINPCRSEPSFVTLYQGILR